MALGSAAAEMQLCYFFALALETRTLYEKDLKSLCFSLKFSLTNGELGGIIIERL